MGRTAIHWFRKGLRLHDNPALLHASEEGVDTLIPLYVFDPEELTPQKRCGNRMGHLLETLSNLNENLKKKGSRLVVALGKPSEVVPLLIKDLGVDLLTYEFDDEPNGKKRDKEIAALLNAGEETVEIKSFCSHTLYDLSYLLRLSGGKPPLTMPVFLSLLSNAGSPPLPVDAPKTLPSCPSIDRINKIKSVKMYNAVPSLSDFTKFGYNAQSKTTHFIGGEDEAIKRMEKFLSQKRRVAKYEKPKTLPTTLEPDSTALSPYTKFGSLSVRLFLSRIKEVYATCGRDYTKPPVSLEGQLYWRELSYLIACSIPNFEKQVGNPVSKQIPWYTGEKADTLLKSWENGETGIPSVDAVMNQLRNEGWIHHLARHLVSCFVTRGDLWLHWEAGRGIFDRYLIDADFSLNNFNWHWMSCSALHHQYFRCHKPSTFFKKMDPESNYIRRHLPILKHFPDEYICEPWSAPMDVQVKAKCIIGKDYPKPIVDHHVACKENMAKMKEAFDDAKKTLEVERGRSNSQFKRVCFENYDEKGFEPSPKKRRGRFNTK